VTLQRRDLWEEQGAEAEGVQGQDVEMALEAEGVQEGKARLAEGRAVLVLAATEVTFYIPGTVQPL